MNMTKTDGTSSTFTVKNGAKGSTGAAGQNGADGKSAYQYAQDSGYTGTEAEFAEKLAQEADIPTALPNPNALTIVVGNTSVTYDGTEAMTITIPDGSDISY